MERIKSYGNRITHFISETDAGMYNAINKGISLASGDIIGMLHSDDLFDSPVVLEKIAETFASGNYDAVYGDLEYVSKNDLTKVVRYWKSSPFNVQNFKKGWMPAHPTLFMKKKIYDLYGMFNTTYQIASDYDFILRTLGSGKLNCKYLPIVITRMRLGGASNKSLKNIWIKSHEDWLALRRNGIGGFRILFRKNISKITQFIRK